MRWNNVRWIFFLFFIIQANIGFAQQPDLKFSTLNALQNISNINATDIIQDQAGYLWIGTDQGLFRFDGQTIYTYQHNEKDENTLPLCRINKLFLDRAGNLWIGTTEGLYKYNPVFDNFTPIVVDGDMRGLAGYNIDVIAEDSKDQIYVGYEKTVYKYNSQENQFAKVTELKEGRIHALIFDLQNNIWIASYLNGGLNYYDQKKKQLTSFLHEKNNPKSIANNEIYNVALIRQNLWITTLGGGIDSYNLTNNTFKHYVSSNSFENFALHIFVDKNQNLWVCTLGSLKLFNPSTDSFYNYYPDPDDPNSLGKNLLSFYEDHQGNYWTVHAVGGIKIARNEDDLKKYDTNTKNFWHLSEKNITAMSFDGSGNLWIGNYNNGIDVFRFQDQKTDRFLHNDNNPTSLGNGSIFSIFRDSKNRMWIGSNIGGLQCFNPETKSFETFRNNPDDSLTIANNDVRSITEDKDGYLWIALEGKGIDRFDRKTNTFRHYNSQKNHLSTNYFFQVFNDSKGNLWVGTSWGLNLLRKGETKFNYFLYSKSDSTTINNNIIHSIYEDNLHNIWIGTPVGLNKFNPENETFTRYSSGLKNKQVAGILSDRKNSLWVSTKSGISRFDPLTRRFTNFDQSDGLLSETFYRMSCCKESNDQLYFGGVEGINYFNPDSLYLEIKPPTVVLTDFRLFNKSVNFKSDNTIIQKHISIADKIFLDYKNNSFSFLYQSINLTKSDKITYAYKLEGFDRDWIYAGAKREASFTNLNPGTYTFRVKAKYDNGDWSKKETSIKLLIVPAWWMTIWFKILMGLIILMAPIGLVLWRIKRLHDQREKLEKLVAERTAEIQTKNELLNSQAFALTQKNDQLKDLNSTKDRLFSIISHDLRSPFNAILGFQDLLLHDYFELSEVERLNKIRKVHSITSQVYYLVDNLLNWASIQSSNIQHKPVRFNVKDIIFEKLDLYRTIAESKGIHFAHQLPDDLIAYADVDLLETTLRNLINNAIKFTPNGGNILVHAWKNHEFIQFSVVDSGIGMTPEQIASLFDLEKTKSKNGTNGEKGSGLGLVLCKELVEKNNGIITVKSQPEEGSTFSFTIPASPQE